MFKFLSFKSLRSKLFLVAVAIGVLPIILYGYWSLSSDVGLIRDVLKKEVESLSAVIGDRSIAALVFDDPDQAYKNLNSLKYQKLISIACIYNANKNVFAVYKHSSEKNTCEVNDIENVIDDSSIYFEKNLIQDGKIVGSLLLLADRDYQQALYKKHKFMLFFSILLASICSLLLFLYAKIVVLLPIEKIADATKKVAEGDYAIELQVESNDELGQLTRLFNTMIKKIVTQNKDIVSVSDRMLAIYDYSPVMLLLLDQEYKIKSVNKTTIINFNSVLLNRADTSLLHYFDEQNIDEFKAKFNGSLKTNNTQHITLKLNPKYFPTEVFLKIFMSTIPTANDDLEVLLVCQDVTEELRLTEVLEYRAYHDELTKLPNRHKLKSTLQTVIDASSTDKRSVLLLSDLDKFKLINDTKGHLAGDAYLQQLTNAFITVLDDDHHAFRLGGDEFCFLLEDSDIEKGCDVANKLMQVARSLIFNWDGKSFSSTVSVGGVLLDGAISDPGQAISLSDLACYIAKSNGGDSQYIINTKEDDSYKHHRDQFIIAAEFQDFFNSDKFVLYAQPIIDLKKDDKRQHIEVLIRMRDSEKGIINAGEFMPAIERYGKSHELDKWVIYNTFKWLSTKDSNAYLAAINVSSSSLTNFDFITCVHGWIKEFNIDPRSLCFEITETGMMQDFEVAGAFVNYFSALGAEFSLDDFGSGFASYEYLRRFPVNYLKIDGSFVSNIVSDQFDQKIVESIIALAEEFSLSLIAEWIEDKDVLDYLKVKGVDYGQGFYLGVPKPLVDFA